MMVAPGLWTPWADVTCYACYDGSERDPVETEPEYVGHCEHCDREIALGWQSVADCQRAARTFGGTLVQTGGMCVATLIQGDGWHVLISAEDSDPEHPGRTYWASRYPGDYDTCDSETWEDLTTSNATLTELGAALRAGGVL